MGVFDILNTAKNSAELAQYIKNDPACVFERDALSRTVLHYTVKYANISMTKLVLSFGADIDAHDKRGRVPLMFAVNFAMVKFLVEKGANIDEFDKRANSVLHYFADGDQNTNYQIIKYLIIRGVDVNRKNLDGYTAIQSAAERGNFDTVRLLNEVAYDNNNIIEYCVIYNETELLEELIKKGQSIDYVCPKTGLTPLHIAVRDGLTETFKYLVGAKQVPDKRGFLPLDYAVEFGHMESVKFLLENGAKPLRRNLNYANLFFNEEMVGLLKEKMDPEELNRVDEEIRYLPESVPLDSRKPSPPAEVTVGPVETPVGPVETPVGPVETPVGPVETPVSPVETPVSPVETPVIEKIGYDSLSHSDNTN